MLMELLHLFDIGGRPTCPTRQPYFPACPARIWTSTDSGSKGRAAEVRDNVMLARQLYVPDFSEILVLLSPPHSPDDLRRETKPSFGRHRALGFSTPLDSLYLATAQDL